MDKLYEVLGESNVKDLLVGRGVPVAISMAPGSGVIPAGTVIYRDKSSLLYARATSTQMDGTYDLLVLRDDVDISTNAGIAVAAAAYEEGDFKAGTLKVWDSGESAYVAVTAAQALILRQQNINLVPFDDWRKSDVEFDNRVALNVTVTYGENGTASTDKATAKKGEIVTLTATPSSSSYVFDKWEIISGDITIGADNKFTMPDTAVSVKATFKSA